MLGGRESAGRIVARLAALVGWAAVLPALLAGPARADDAARRIAGATASASTEGRFGANGERARLELFRVPGAHLSSDILARVASPACSAQLSALPAGYPDQAQPMVVDLDGDGRDEVLTVIGGNTVDEVTVLRVDGCRVTCVEQRGSPYRCEGFPVHGRGMSDPGGVGGFCRAVEDGKTEIVAVDHSSWSRYDLASDRMVTNDRVEWRRRTFRLEGGELVAVADERGTTTIPHDPSVPLVNSFACAGIRYRAEPAP